MRAGALVRALAQVYRVTLLITPRFGGRAVTLPEEVAAACERVVRVAAGERLPTRRRFDVVLVYGLASWPDAAPWLRQAAATHLDLPDLESATQRRLATLAHETGRSDVARGAEAAAAQARALEDSALATFDRVSVCSETDHQALLRRAVDGAEVVVLPNSLPAPVTTPFPPPDRASLVLLFVGTLGYPPNEDAMQFFTAGILPRIQAGANRPVTLRIVGTGASAAVRRLGGQAGVELIGEVEEVAAWYRDAHLAVIPIRAGGGTRIKALEAFIHHRPVVTTSIGIEGIAAEEGRHVLIANDPARFAIATLRLLNDPEFSERLAGAAFDLFRQSYADDVVARTVAALAAPRQARRAGSGRGSF